MSELVRAEPGANIAMLLTAMARRYPELPAVICARPHGASGASAPPMLTLRELDEESDLLARGLARIDVGPGVRAALMVPPGIEFFALTFALFKAGAVPVLIDPGIGLARLKRCLADSAPAAFIGIPKAQWARLVLRWGAGSVRTAVSVGGTIPGAHRLDDVRALGRAARSAAGDGIAADPTAAILFTSGATGPPKGVVYTHGMFLAQVEYLRSTFAIEPGEIDLATFPLFGLFGPALGMTAVIPAMDPTRPAEVDPRNVFAAIARYGATSLFGSPALLDTVGRAGAARGVRLPTLRRVITAGAPVGPRILERFAALLRPEVDVYTPYGATEALPVSTIASREILEETAAESRAGRGTCVGRPVAGLDVAVIPIDDGAIPRFGDGLRRRAGEIGEIAVRGPVVSRGYFRRPEADALAKMTDGEGAIWHRMGDLGYLDEAGRLWFCGRKAERVITRTATYFTVPCEGVFDAHPAVRRSALVGASSGSEMKPALCIEPETPLSRSARRRVREELLALAARHAQTAALREILFHRGFPVDTRHNAKIQRSRLAEWAERRLRRGARGRA